MRTALGQPLSNIPASVLNQMISKDVARDMRKFKLNAGTGTKTASKRSKSRGAEDSPNSLKGNRRSKSNEAESQGGSLVTQIRNQLRDLDRGIADRTSLLKSQVIGCDESFK